MSEFDVTRFLRAIGWIVLGLGIVDGLVILSHASDPGRYDIPILGGVLGWTGAVVIFQSLLGWAVALGLAALSDRLDDLAAIRRAIEKLTQSDSGVQEELVNLSALTSWSASTEGARHSPESASQTQRAQPGEPSLPTGPRLDEGAAVSDIVDGALGLQWGRAPDGKTVYREAGSKDWVVYQGGAPLVPPRGYRTPRSNE